MLFAEKFPGETSVSRLELAVSISRDYLNLAHGYSLGADTVSFGVNVLFNRVLNPCSVIVQTLWRADD